MEPETLTMDGTEPRVSAEPETLKNYIGGEWVESATSEFIDDIDAATGEVLARVPLSTAGDVDAAAQAARAAQPAGPPSRSPSGRGRCSRSARRSEPTATSSPHLVTEDMGKALDDARGEVGRGSSRSRSPAGSRRC